MLNPIIFSQITQSFASAAEVSYVLAVRYSWRLLKLILVSIIILIWRSRFISFVPPPAGYQIQPQLTGPIPIYNSAIGPEMWSRMEWQLRKTASRAYWRTQTTGKQDEKYEHASWYSGIEQINHIDLHHYFLSPSKHGIAFAKIAPAENSTFITYDWILVRFFSAILMAVWFLRSLLAHGIHFWNGIPTDTSSPMS